MEWTETAPSKPGWYWMSKEGGKPKLDFAKLLMSSPGLHFGGVGVRTIYPALWYGPLSPPELPKIIEGENK